jgi:hypothetical protein
LPPWRRVLFAAKILSVWAFLIWERIGNVLVAVPNRKGYDPWLMGGSDLRSRQLWSLWDVIKISIAKYIELGMDAQDLSAIYGALNKSTPAMGIASAFKPNDKMSGEEKQALLETLRRTKSLCAEIGGLPNSLRMLSWLEDDPPETWREFKLLISSIRAEMEDRLLLVIPDHMSRYYEADDLVSDAVVVAFPKASEEIRSSGSCLAAGLHTACVFHSMRAAEIGLRVLGTEYKVKIKSGKDIALAEWREILDGLNSAVQEIENSPNSMPDKDTRLQFCSEAAAQVRFFKNGWRIRAAHARAIYNEPQAKEAIDHVRSFFEFLATALRE